MRKIILAIPVIALAALTGCSSFGHHSAAVASASARAHAAATSTSAQYVKLNAKQVLDKCVGVNAANEPLTMQLSWIKGFAGKQGKQERHQFLVCANNGQPVTAAEQAKFQQQVQSQGEAALKVYARDEASGNKVAARAVIKNFVTNQVEQDAVAARQ